MLQQPNLAEEVTGTDGRDQRLPVVHRGGALEDQEELLTAEPLQHEQLTLGGGYRLSAPGDCVQISVIDAGEERERLQRVQVRVCAAASPYQRISPTVDAVNSVRSVEPQQNVSITGPRPNGQWPSVHRDGARCCAFDARSDRTFRSHLSRDRGDPTGVTGWIHAWSWPLERAAPGSGETIWYHMLVRTETLVQLDDRLLAVLDQEAQRRGVSRSALIREAIEQHLRDEVESTIDDALVEGYQRMPPDEPDELERLAAIVSIEAEPW